MSIDKQAFQIEKKKKLKTADLNIDFGRRESSISDMRW